MTSIYDHSIFEALSKVVHKLIPQHRQLERLLDYLCNVIIFKPFKLKLYEESLLSVQSPVFVQSELNTYLNSSVCLHKRSFLSDITGKLLK